MRIGWRALARMAVVGTLVASAAVVGTQQAAAEPAAPASQAAYDCGLNTWTTWEPYFGTLIHYLYRNCEQQSVQRKLYTTSNPGYPSQCHVIAPGQELYMGYAGTAGFPPDRAVPC